MTESEKYVDSRNLMEYFMTNRYIAIYIYFRFRPKERRKGSENEVESLNTKVF